MKLTWTVFLSHFSFIVAAHSKILHPNLSITVALSERNLFMTFDPNGTPKGLDVMLLENFARKFSLDIKYVIMNTSLNGVFTDKKDWSSFLIQNRLTVEADVFIGDLHMNNLSNEHFTTSHPYFHDELTWCVQKSQTIPSWKKIFYLCNDPLVWILHTIMNFSSVLLIFSLQRFEDLQPKWDWNRITLAGFAFFLGVAYRFRPQIFPLRVYYTFVVFGCMLYSNVILSAIINIIWEPIYQHQVKSIKEVVDGSFEMVGDELALRHMIQNNEVSL